MRASINYLMDTGPLVAMLIENEKYHEWSMNVLSVLDEPVYTTEIVIAETCHLLRNRVKTAAWRTIMQWIQGRILRIEHVLPDEAEHIENMMVKYPQMDLGDATLVALSEQFPGAKLITIDRKDFSIYRRKDGSDVPAIMPPA